MIIYVDTPLRKELRDRLQASANGDTCIFRSDLDEPEQKAAIAKAEILFGNPRPVELLEHAHNLKWMQLYSTGFEYYRSLKISAVVTNMQDYFSEPCAETVLAGILALYRGTHEFVSYKNEKKWVGYSVRLKLNVIANKQVLILGAGNIAKRLAKILSAFDCRVHFFARRKEDGIINSLQELESLIPQLDIIISCLPGTEETTGLITPKMISLMRPSAIFCNVGRGNVVADENSLVRALMDKQIGGAVLDVTSREPLPADHPFWHCPNTILSQHSGGGDASEYDGLLDFFLQNLDRYRLGKPLMNVVDLGRGY